jgi:hypothetical protein
MPLHNAKVGVWCVLSASKLLGPFYFGIIHSNLYVTHSDAIFEHLPNYKGTYASSHQDGATANITNHSHHHLSVW